MQKCASYWGRLHASLVFMSNGQFDLSAMARQEMIADGFHPDFPAGVIQQVKALQAQPARRPPEQMNGGGAQDLEVAAVVFHR